MGNPSAHTQTSSYRFSSAGAGGHKGRPYIACLLYTSLGPGFTAGVDCHGVVETMRGHDLGRLLTRGSACLLYTSGIPASLSDVITGVLLFFMLGCEFFINYKLVFRGAEERHKRKEAAK